MLTRRTRAREVAMQVLYQDDLNSSVNPGDADEFLRRRLQRDDQVEFARSLVGGVRRNRGELDELLGKAAENWSLSRMAAADRNILRIAAFEMTYTTTPRRAIINEAVELAKRYGTAASAAFANGVLDRLFHDLEQNAPDA